MERHVQLCGVMAKIPIIPDLLYIQIADGKGSFTYTNNLLPDLERMDIIIISWMHVFWDRVLIVNPKNLLNSCTFAVQSQPIQQTRIKTQPWKSSHSHYSYSAWLHTAVQKQTWRQLLLTDPDTCKELHPLQLMDNLVKAIALTRIISSQATSLWSLEEGLHSSWISWDQVKTFASNLTSPIPTLFQIVLLACQRVSSFWTLECWTMQIQHSTLCSDMHTIQHHWKLVVFQRTLSDCCCSEGEDLEDLSTMLKWIPTQRPLLKDQAH